MNNLYSSLPPLFRPRAGRCYVPPDSSSKVPPAECPPSDTTGAAPSIGIPIDPNVAVRAAAFREQLAAWREQGRDSTPDAVPLLGGPHPCLPMFTLPKIGAVKPGGCISCGERLDAGRRYRCSPCLDAVHVVLEGA